MLVDGRKKTLYSKPTERKEESKMKGRKKQGKKMKSR
jgi:hypothetical protein